MIPRLIESRPAEAERIWKESLVQARVGRPDQTLAWYDREAAAALFEPSRARKEHTEDRELATWSNEFLASSFVDLRAAVARLEKVPASSDPGRDANAARTFVATFLGLPHEARWRKIWSDWETIFRGPKRGFWRRFTWVSREQLSVLIPLRPLCRFGLPRRLPLSEPTARMEVQAGMDFGSGSWIDDAASLRRAWIFAARYSPLYVRGAGGSFRDWIARARDRDAGIARVH